MKYLYASSINLNNMEIDINNISSYKEDNRIEAKRASDNIPNSIWETYSAFANTDGGIILLGVTEKDDKSLQLIGVKNPDKLVTDFWNIVNNRQKVSLNVLTNRMVEIQEINNKSIVSIRVPKADRRQRPIFVGLDPMKGTYRRDYDGDHFCTTDEVAAMYRDASDRSMDMRVIKYMDLSVFDIDTVHRYRNRFRQFHNGHIWNEDEDEIFLRRIGAVAVYDEDMQFHPTAAGLLMFGREYDIVREFPDYFLDYQERLDNNTRWTHRWVSSSGDWSGNLYDFFFKVYSRLTEDFPIPFITNGKDRIDETPLHLAIREVLLNLCAHADHYGRQGIVIIKKINTITLTNPGDIRIGLKAALTGGVSDPRNVTIMKMFSLVDIGERAGSGIPDFISIWKKYVDKDPIYTVTHNPDRTSLVIPFTPKSFQIAGKMMANNTQSTQSTQSISQSTPQSTPQSTNKNKISKTAQDILDLIRQNPQITYDEIAITLGKARSGVARHLKNMCESGYILPKKENGLWVVLINE